jgi:Leucine-rich repeat (LRR) protein
MCNLCGCCCSSVLAAAANWITGTLPDWLRKLKQLERLSMGSNQLQGTLPAWIGEDLPRLEVLNLGVNTGVNPGGMQGLSGTIPASLGKLSNLAVLNLELNAFVGVLPAGLCGPESKLRALKLRGNRLNGSIEPLMSCSELTQLDISSNNFSGVFAGPHAVGIWPQLAVLDASSNAFVGPLPQSVYELPMLEFLNLANNRCAGCRISFATALQHGNLIRIRQL